MKKITEKEFGETISAISQLFDGDKRTSPDYLAFKAELENKETGGIKASLEWLGLKQYELASTMLLVLKDAGYKTTDATMPALLTVYQLQKDARTALGHQQDVRFMARDIMHKAVIDTFA